VAIRHLWMRCKTTNCENRPPNSPDASNVATTACVTGERSGLFAQAVVNGTRSRPRNDLRPSLSHCYQPRSRETIHSIVLVSVKYWKPLGSIAFSNGSSRPATRFQVRVLAHREAPTAARSSSLSKA
jgi:hypothetical protein